MAGSPQRRPGDDRTVQRSSFCQGLLSDYGMAVEPVLSNSHFMNSSIGGLREMPHTPDGVKGTTGSSASLTQSLVRQFAESRSKQ